MKWLLRFFGSFFFWRFWWQRGYDVAQRDVNKMLQDDLNYLEAHYPPSVVRCLPQYVITAGVIKRLPTLRDDRTSGRRH